MSKRCPNCAAEVPHEASFCSNCGHPISHEADQKAHTQQGEWSFSNSPEISSTPSLTARSGGGGFRTVLETWSGLAAMGAGILALAAVLARWLGEVWLEPEAYLPLRVLEVSFLGLSTLLLAIVLPGLQTRQAGRVRRLGRAGYILAMIGVIPFSAVFLAFSVWIALPRAAFSVWWGSSDVVLYPVLLLLGGGATLVGIAVFGIATARANVLPRWAAVMFALGLPVGIASGWLYYTFLAEGIDNPVSVVWRVSLSTGLTIFAIGLVRLGHALWAHVRLKKKLSQRLPELSRPHSSRSWLPRTGFGNKTVWDWLQLLIVPIVLAVASFWFTLQQDIRQQATEEQRAQDVALQAYLDYMGELMLKQDAPLGESEEGDEVNTLARSRTLMVLSRLDGDSKARVVQFLHESHLIAKDRQVLDLRGADLHDVILANADLSGANLSGVELRSANLSDANLSDANLSDANLSDANLSDPKLEANLNGANLSNANLERADLDDVALNDADLSDADLQKANLINAVLRDADLRGANLSDADLSDADLQKANLINAVLRDAWLDRAILEGANLSDADLLNTTLIDANLINAVLRDADLRGANLSGADLSDADLSGAQGIIKGTEFVRSLEGATMPNGSKHD